MVVGFFLAETSSPRVSGEREGTYCAAMGRVRGLHQNKVDDAGHAHPDLVITISRPLTPPAAVRRGPPLSPLKRGEGSKAIPC